LPSLWVSPLFLTLPQAIIGHEARSQVTLRMQREWPEAYLQEPLAFLVTVNFAIKTDQHRNQLVLRKHETTIRGVTSRSDPDRPERQDHAWFHRQRRDKTQLLQSLSTNHNAPYLCTPGNEYGGLSRQRPQREDVAFSCYRVALPLDRALLTP
jgi:hypothetical protein